MKTYLLRLGLLLVLVIFLSGCIGGVPNPFEAIRLTDVTAEIDPDDSDQVIISGSMENRSNRDRMVTFRAWLVDENGNALSGTVEEHDEEEPLLKGMKRGFGFSVPNHEDFDDFVITYDSTAI